jgi:hypothetical protein
MALKSYINKANLISPMDDKSPSALHPGLLGIVTVRYSGVIPGNYIIPSILSDPQAVAKVCMAKVFVPGRSDLEREDHQYARIITAPDGKPMTVLTVVEARTVMHLAGNMERDEFGQKMEPPIPRALIPVRAEELANAIEMDYAHMGVRTIVGEEPTMEEVAAARVANYEYKQNVVATTSREFKRFGERAVSIQARRIAWQLKQEGKLPALPEWAMANPDALTINVRNCPTCSAILQENAKICITCRHIFDWKYAVESGLVPPQNVPPSKRVEAGLEAPPEVRNADTPEEVQVEG